MTDQNVPYETIFNAMSEGFVLCDAIVDESGKLIDYTVAQTNPAVQKMLSVGPDVHGKRLSETEFYSPVWLALCEQVFATGSPVNFEFHNPSTGQTHEIRVSRVGGNRLAQFFFDVTDRKRAEEAQDLLLREMNHRVKNIFAVINGVVSLSSRSARSPKEMAEAVQGRIEAIGRAHALVVPTTLRPVANREQRTDLRTLTEAVLEPFAAEPNADNAARLVIEGSLVPLGNTASSALALILHELATNAAKYGALSELDGSVTVAWRVVDDHLHLQWLERGGPPIDTPPSKTGFGSLLTHRSVAGQLGGTVSEQWERDGVIVEIRAPVERLSS